MKGLVGTAALVASLSQNASAQPTTDLIADITSKLKSIMTASKTEQKDNDAAFAKVQCECKEMIKEAEEKIPVLEKDIAEGEALIETLRSDSEEKSMKVNSLQEKIASDRELIAERTKKRADDFAVWQENDTNWAGSIAQLNDAIKVLAEGTTPAFLQEHSSQGKQLIAAVSKVESAAAHTAELISLLQSQTNAKNSGQVLGVLNKMLQMFEENKADALAEETKSKKMFDAWLKRTNEEIAAAEKLISDLQGIMASNTSTITSTQTAVKTAKADLETMKKQLADFTKKLEEYTEEHSALTKESLELQEGLQKAITFLNSEEARAKLAALVPSFLQTRAALNKKHSFLAQQEQPASLLATAFALQKSGITAKAGAEVGVWTTVLQSIGDLKQAQEENIATAKAKAKDCDAQMKVHFNVWKELIADQLDLEDKKNSLELALSDAEEAIKIATETIASKSSEIEQLEAETREIQTEFRTYADNAKAATPILKKTIQILSEPGEGVEPTKGEFGAAVQNKGTVSAVKAIEKVIDEMNKHVESLKQEYEKTNSENAALIQDADDTIKASKKELATATGDKGENAGNLALCKTNLEENANSQLTEKMWWGEEGTNDKWGTGYTCAVYMGREDLREMGNRVGDWAASPEQGQGPYYTDVSTAAAELVELGKVEDIISGLQSGLEG